MAVVLKLFLYPVSLSHGTVSLAAMNHGTLKLEVGNSKGDSETQTWEFSLLTRVSKYCTWTILYM
jgi:hypothetical protein